MDSVSRMGNLHAHISGRLPVVCSVEPVVVTFTLTYAVLVMRGTLLVLLHLENDYFCDSVATINNWSANPFRFYPDNALWDGQSSLNTCYNNNNPPWFMKTLSTPTTDDIELRMCAHYSSSYANIGLELMEIYIS